MTHRYGTTKSQGGWPCGLTAAVLMLAWPAAATPAETHPGPEVATEKVDNGFLRQQDDVSAVTQIVLRERQARDQGWWDRMMASYWPDSRVDVSWYHGDGPGFVYASRKVADGGDKGLHRLGPPIVDIRGNKAFVQVGSQNWTLATVNGKAANLLANMQLNYRLEKRGGEWRILSLTPVYEHSTLSADVPGEPIAISAKELAKFRPSYAALCWVLTRRGLNMSQEELGIDRPDGVTAFYAAIEQWLGE